MKKNYSKPGVNLISIQPACVILGNSQLIEAQGEPNPKSEGLFGAARRLYI